MQCPQEYSTPRVEGMFRQLDTSCHHACNDARGLSNRLLNRTDGLWATDREEGTTDFGQNLKQQRIGILATPHWI